MAPIFTGLAALRQLSQALRPVAARRGFASAASGKGNMQSDGKEENVPKPTYVYQSPGSSLKEPGYGTGHSLGSPTYEYDPKPRASLSDPLPSMHTSTPKTISKAPSPETSAAVAAAESMQDDAAKPSYVYPSPGSSMREPSYGFSVKDPVYVVDPAPPSKGKSAAAKNNKKSPPGQPTTLQAVAPPPPANKLRVGLSQDDLAQQPYVTSPKGSMREPHYVSVSDPR